MKEWLNTEKDGPAWQRRATESGTQWAVDGDRAALGQRPSKFSFSVLNTYGSPDEFRALRCEHACNQHSTQKSMGCSYLQSLSFTQIQLGRNATINCLSTVLFMKYPFPKEVEYGLGISRPSES